MRPLRIAAAAAALLLAAACLLAQRRVTPVGQPSGIARDLPLDSLGRPTLPHIHDSIGNIIFIDSIAGKADTLVITADTIAKPRMIYPLLHSVSVGADVWDPIMRALGQRYGGASLWAELSMHNRYFPYLEAGLSAADVTPEDHNFTYYSPLAPFFKVGIGYNIFYNSNPAYQLKFGVRYGFTPFSYEIRNVTVDEGYWDAQAHFSIPSQSVTAGYVEVVAAIKVTLWRNLALGWALKWHSIVHESAAPSGKPMVIPGYGNRNNTFTGAFSIIYTLPLNSKGAPVVNNSERTGEAPDGA